MSEPVHLGSGRWGLAGLVFPPPPQLPSRAKALFMLMPFASLFELKAFVRRTYRCDSEVRRTHRLDLVTEREPLQGYVYEVHLLPPEGGVVYVVLSEGKPSPRWHHFRQRPGINHPEHAAQMMLRELAG